MPRILSQWRLLGYATQSLKSEMNGKSRTFTISKFFLIVFDSNE